MDLYVTTAIPYVNAAPHVGFALEIVLADAIARWNRRAGRAVRFQTGTDDNSLKNVRAALAAGLPPQELVDRNAARFAALRGAIDLSFDEFVRTSRDPRHRVAVEALWRACAANGDVYRRAYRGLYCVGCEQFYPDGTVCPEHRTRLEPVEEDNWFFRLSNYAGPLREAIESGRLRIVPETRRNEALAFIAAGLEDFSISRSSERAHGWGIPVPGDASQVIYVWFDALTNYIASRGYGTGALDAFWSPGSERLHIIGKNVTRFHVIYWPAILLSAGLPLPTTVLAHGFLTTGGAKIAKSSGNAIDPVEVVARHGTDAVRFALLRRSAWEDADFSVDGLVALHRAELADQLGNLLSRVVALIEQRCDGVVPLACEADAAGASLLERTAALPQVIASSFGDLAPDRGLASIIDVVAEANRYIVRAAPWQDVSLRAHAALGVLGQVLATTGWALWPFIPGKAAEIARRLGAPDPSTTPSPLRAAGLRVSQGPPLFPRRASEPAGYADRR